MQNEQLENIGSIATPPEWWGNKCPQQGKFRCDFTSTSRPPEGSAPLSDHRFKGIINKLGLRDILPLRDRLEEYHRIASERRHKRIEQEKIRRARRREARKREAEKRENEVRAAAVIPEGASVEDLLAAAEKQKELGNLSM